MNSTLDERVRTLLAPVINSAGLSNSAMIDTIIFAFDMMNSYYDELMEELFVDTMHQWGLRRYKELFDIDFDTDDTESRQIISDKMKKCISYFEKKEFDNFLKTIDSSIAFNTKDYVMTISGMDFSFVDSLPLLSKKLSELAPPMGRVQLNNSGASYQDWDDKDFTFLQYEALDSPFSIIDTL